MSKSNSFDRKELHQDRASRFHLKDKVDFLMRCRWGRVGRAGLDRTLTFVFVVSPSLKPRFSDRVARIGVTLVLLLTMLGGAAQAQLTRTWDGGGPDNNWSTPGNWSSDNVPDVTGEAALFTDDPLGQTKLTPNLSADVTIGQLQFSATAPGYTITGTGPSTLFLSPTASYGGVGVIVASGAANQSITAAEVEFLSSQSWDIGGTTTLTVTGTIEDDSVIDYGLTKNGTGTLVFPGDVRYDGPTIVNAGALVLSFNNTSMLSALTVNGGILRGTTSPNALGNNSTRNTITFAGGALELANDTGLTFGSTSRRTTLTGNVTIRSDRLTAGAGVTHTLGTLTIGAQTLAMTAGANATSGTAGITFGATTLSGNATFDVANSRSAGAQLTLGAVGQSGGARALTKAGNGTLRLNGAGSYTGGTTLGQGAITLGIANALGSGGFNFAGGNLNANNITDSTIGALALTADSTLNLSPGGTAATLTFAGVSGTASGVLTITGWSGSPGGLGTNDKIIFSGGTTPDADFLEHIHFDLGDGNTNVGALGAGGELFPRATSAPPNQPTSISPANGAVDIPTSMNLSVMVSDPENDVLTVTFHGRVASPPAGNDFTLIALPDTQYYVSSLNGGLPAMFTNQTQWIVNQRVNRNIQYVAQLGDCTQNGDNNGNDDEWRHATNALYRLENPVTTSLPHGVPYGVAVGNHDQGPNGNGDPNGTTTFYNQYFGTPHFQGYNYYGGHYSSNNDNHYDLFSASGLDFIVFYFEYNAGMTTNSPVLAWANSVLQTNQNRRAIVVSHWIINAGTNATFSTQGQAIYNALKGNTNLFLMLSGHVTPPEGQRMDVFQGRTVWSLMSDYQGSSNGGNGKLRIYEFSPSNNVIRAKTYSPWLDQFETDADSQFDVPYLMTPTNPFSVLGAVSGVASGSVVTQLWTGLAPNTTYDWYVSLTDGITTTVSPIWSFTTGDAPPTNTIVPNVVGLSRSAAGETLSLSNLTTGTISYTNDATVAAGLVVDQHPAVGTSVAHGAAVDLIISLGSEGVLAGISGEIEILPLPPNLNGGQFISPLYIHLMDESTGVVTAGMPTFPYDSAIHDPSLPVVSGDDTFGNAIVTPYAGPGLPVVGTEVRSILLHFDPDVSDLPFDLTQGIAQSATITFDRPIIGVYVTSGALNATDDVFTPSGTIFPASVGRDMEFNYDGDQYAISVDRRTLALTMFSHNGGVLDQLRVILAAESNPGVTVPDVIGLTEAAASTALEEAGFVVTTSLQASATVPLGNVISQNPAGGSTAPFGSEVVLIISSGLPTNITLANAQSAQSTTQGSFVDLSYTVPGVTGQNLVLVVYGGAEDDVTSQTLPTGATFHGVAMNVVAQHLTPASGFNAGSGMYWLPVALGETGTIRINFTGACDERAVGAVTLVGAATDGPEAVETATGTSSLSDQITTLTPNAIIITTATQGNSSALTPTGTGHTLDVSAGLASSRVAAGHAEAATPGSRTLGYSGSINRIAMILASFPVGAPPSPPVTVPDVVGQTQAAAEATLAAAGLSTGAITTASSTTITTGLVLEQDPTASASVPAGTLVDLVISSGPPPNPPAITQHPTNQTVIEPDPATFEVIAGGDAPLFYQWRRNGTNIVGPLLASPGNLIASEGSGLPNGFEASGAVWHPVRQKLFVVGDGGTIAQMDADGGSVVTWTPGNSDLEGICVADPTSDFVYLGVEQSPVSIQEFDVTTGLVTRTFNLETWMGGHGNDGLEALTFVPDASHPEGGLFYTGLQADGRIFVFSLPIRSSSSSTTVTHVETITPQVGLSDIAGLDYDSVNGVLYAIFDTANRLVAMRLDGTTLMEWSLPGNDQEGFSLSPSSDGFITQDTGEVIRYALGVPSSPEYTLDQTSVANDDGTQFDVVVRNHAGSATSTAATLTVHPTPVIVPDVVGQSQEQAANTLQTAGLEVTILMQASVTVPLGNVISQNPAGGTEVSAGSTVEIVISSGVTVPSVVGQSEFFATTTLEAVGLSVSITTQVSSTVPLGNVITQNPSAGAQVSGGTTITLVVSLGVTLAEFAGTPTNGSSPLEVAFSNLSIGGTNYSWDFGDGHTSSQTNPVNIYSNAGSYTVSLTAVGPAGTNTLVRGNYVVLSNAPPALLPIPDQIVFEEAVLSLVASASDPDVDQVLSFGLQAGAPESATINATSGVLTWTPTSEYVFTTNVITVVVTDDGVPALSDSKSFSVAVLARPRLMNMIELEPGSFALSWHVQPGRIYQLQFLENLAETSWATVGEDFSPTTPDFVITNYVGTNRQGFYRLLDLSTP